MTDYPLVRLVPWDQVGPAIGGGIYAISCD